MSPKSTRVKELRQLRESAGDLWRDQQAVLQKANVVVKEAGRQAADRAREEIVPRKRRRHRGRIVVLGLVIVLVTGLAYAVWQTFRADDELWVSDETPKPADPPTTDEH